MKLNQNIFKVISSQVFTKPNNFILTSCYRPVYLQRSDQPTIEYLHSAKSLSKTIRELQSLANTQNPTYAKDIQSELNELKISADSYAGRITRYVKDGGLLTGQGIANIYFSAEKLNLDSEWLQKNIHHQIPSKYKYMTRDNLVDTLAGLNKYHKGSSYIKQLQEQLSRLPELQYEYAVRLPNDISVFRYGDNCKSNHPLLNAIKGNRSKLVYYIYHFANLAMHRGRRVLHSE